MYNAVTDLRRKVEHGQAQAKQQPMVGPEDTGQPASGLHDLRPPLEIVGRAQDASLATTLIRQCSGKSHSRGECTSLYKPLC